MNKPICSLCLCPAETVKQLDLYITGSEGMCVCHPCEMALVNHCRELRSMAARVRKEEYIKAMRLNSQPKEQHETTYNAAPGNRVPEVRHG